MIALTHPLLATALENALWVALLAPCLLLVGRLGPPARWLHVLWVLLLLKLLAPPLLRIPLPAWPTLGVASTSGATLEIGGSAAVGHDGTFAVGAMSWIVLVWALGTAVALVLARVRTCRFRDLVGTASEAPRWIVDEARSLARELDLPAPVVTVVDARLAPCVWSLRRRPHLVLPAALLDRLSDDERRMMLRHELTHVRRGDPWVRLVELAVGALYWWHPAVWLARRELHRLEELCCDAQVLSRCPRGARAYASALVETVDFLAGADARPARAPAFGEGAAMRERVVAILRSTPGRARRGTGLVLLACAGLLATLPTSAPVADTGGHDSSGMLRSIHAHDPAGTFRLDFAGADVVAVVRDDVRLERHRWEQEPGRLLVFNADGSDEFAVCLHDDGGISWQPRTPTRAAEAL